MPRIQKQEIKTDKAPRIPGGPLCQGIKAGSFIFISCAPIDLAGKPVIESFERATRQMMENTREIVKVAGSSMHGLIHVVVYLQDMKNFDEFNRIYCEYIPEPFPARSISQPTRSPGDLLCGMVVTALAD